MQGGFGKNAGPGRAPQGPIPAFGTSAPTPPQRPDAHFLTNKSFPSAPEQNLAPPLPSGPNVRSRLTYVRPDAKETAASADWGSGDVGRVSKEPRFPAQGFPRPSTQFLTNNVYQGAPGQNLSRPPGTGVRSRLTYVRPDAKEVAADDDLGSSDTSRAELSKQSRFPTQSLPRPGAQLLRNNLYKGAPGQNLSPPSGSGIHSRLSYVRTDAKEVATNADLGSSDVNRVEHSKQSRFPTQSLPRSGAQFLKNNLYQDTPGQNLSPPSGPSVRSRLTYVRTDAKEVTADTDLGSSDVNRAEFSKQSRLPAQNLPSVVSPSEAQTTFSQASGAKRNRSPVSQHDFPTHSALHEASRRKILPQTSHMKDVVTQTSGKLGDLKALHSPRHAVENSGASTSEPLAESEEEAKARRLARFRAELSQPVEPVEAPVSKAESNKQQDDVDFSEATAIVGLCPDMCPEPERGERERKGDLDKHERLDGDRNQTTKLLAVKKDEMSEVNSILGALGADGEISNTELNNMVKLEGLYMNFLKSKYTRTAERDPELIRPLPVLIKSMNYLLELLNKPYDNDFLGLYNFLWDRMRAIRMDLRMQHIFNLEAISMLEQMIRLHIIAMHELCEYNKGEGFSEGFDAHLNIEQMNKASVELFQMYEDHRRKGISVRTEREFRGYYALLKLDKHPGYKVEPAELSLDLAKMSAEVRRSSEIAFARAVAKACRTGNYVSFFRLAKKATYLQACLMHAHFSKLRTEALASLHSSFPSNQGMPLARLENMLAMEGEDIESFVEDHGFVLKSFEEIYIVKNGPFLRQEGDPLSKWSPLVGTKRSHRIKLDVCLTLASNIMLKEEISNSSKVAGIKAISREKKPDANISDSPKPIKQLDQTQHELQPVTRPPEVYQLPAIIPQKPIDVTVIPPLPLPSPPISTGLVPLTQVSDAHRVATSKSSAPASLAPSSRSEVRVTSSVIEISDQKATPTKKDVPETIQVKKPRENMEHIREKLRPIFRKWRQRARELRLCREKKERKEALVREALESISIGPLLRTSVDKAPKKDVELLNIDHAIRARLRKKEKSWSVLNTSELVTPILAEQNPYSRCLCWKLLLSLPPSPADSLPTKWLLTKFNLNEAGSFVSFSNEWSGPQLSLSFVRAEKTSSFKENSVAGASCMLFLLTGDAPLEAHKERLHNMCNRVPAKSNLPLLITVGDGLNGEDETAIVAKLGLADRDRTKLRDISVIFLNRDLELTSNGFLDDGRLREGVRWLAEHSPPQSEVSLVNTRTILLAYLKLKLEVIGDSYEVGPDQCVAAINESIDWLIRAVLGSATANPNLWPCPETDLLDKFSSERNYAEMILPRFTWNEPLQIQAQKDALNGCKLPCFRFNLSWLSQGSYYTDRKRAQDQKRSLEECIFKYLNLCTGAHEAEEQARGLVQRCTSLVLRDSCLYLVPRWTAIFRRILNMRLIGIPKEASDVYVSEDIANVEYLNNVQWVDLLASNELPILPLDEMMASSFVDAAETAEPTVPTISGVHDEEDCIETQAHSDEGHDGVVPQNYKVPENRGLADKKEPSKFAKLFNQCTKLQDEIDQKLRIYF